MHRLLSLVLLLVCTTIHAQGFPTRPMRILVPYAAGGLLDLMARQIAAQLAEQYGQGVVVENRTGAASAVAVDALRQAGPVASA